MVQEHVPFLPDSASAGDMLRKVTSFQQQSVNAYFGGGYEEMDPSRVRVGTIHSAKGREADHVFMATDLTEKVVEQMAASVSRGTRSPRHRGVHRDDESRPALTDNERRVFYVGMSRARERLRPRKPRHRRADAPHQRPAPQRARGPAHGTVDDASETLAAD